MLRESSIRNYYDGIIYQILPSLKKTILITYSATPPVYIEICFENCYFISKKTEISRLLHNIPYVVFRKCSFHDEIYIVEKTLEILIFKWKITENIENSSYFIIFLMYIFK